ncbi:hypothetical protein KIN34_02905 [Cellulomonas sp. DKR-3]|uniref:Anti-sigma factor n=1 Tax=Cellulomonas fulva TaxID=2835530 RepID=A0ABS5TVQ8_9CELL|nr:hypothetical protein [Cellulomonas fulva]MBT0993239.1 hypothetical protein [Cellulomonas fulva]
MTTFEELDLDEAFGDFGDAGQEPRRRSRVLAVAALVVAAALVVVGVLWARSARDAPDVAAPTDLVPALAAAQGTDDQVPAEDLEDLTVSAPSTRLLASTAYGTHYAALGRDGDVCLVTVSAGELPRETCAAPSERLALTYTDADDETVVMLAPSDAAPAAAEGWAEKVPNLYVRHP